MLGLNFIILLAPSQAVVKLVSRERWSGSRKWACSDSASNRNLSASISGPKLIERIVSMKLDAPYRSGRSKTWIKSKKIRRRPPQRVWSGVFERCYVGAFTFLGCISFRKDRHK